MRLLVGLGNPGSDYARNRHNIGFRVVDAIRSRHELSPWRVKFQGLIADGVIAETRLLVLKPGTYMNLSGQSVAAAAGFHKIDPSDIIVVHDDLDLAPGQVRVKQGGGSGGHNGLKSIDAHLGREYWRVRLGIGHPGDKTLVLPWVLGNFDTDEERWVAPLMAAAAERLPLLLAGEQAKFLAGLPHGEA